MGRMTSRSVSKARLAAALPALRTSGHHRGWRKTRQWILDGATRQPLVPLALGHHVGPGLPRNLLPLRAHYAAVSAR
jgi:hypothetical protein